MTFAAVKKRVHMVGIGGVGMCGIAEILLRTGYAVSGSDLRENDEVERLRRHGARIFVGHRAEQVGDAEAVVYSSAVRADNPELSEARRLHLPVLARADMLAELMRKKRSIVVAGSHGKTTTTAMSATILEHAGLDPTAVIGGRLRSLGSNVRMGGDDWFVCESDESDGSFLKLLPTAAVVTNVDREHLDHYGSFEALVSAFQHFVRSVPFDGVAVLCADDKAAAGLSEGIDRPVVSYGVDSPSDVTAGDVRSEPERTKYDLIVRGETLGEVVLPATGSHLVRNSLAAAAVALFAGVPPKGVIEGLRAFSGIDRRLERKGRVRGVMVIDDYAHHPTEVRATVESLRTIAIGRPVRVLFQPHRYTRTRDLWDEFLSAFEGIESLVLLPVYAAGETPLRGVDSERLLAAIRQVRTKPSSYASSLEEGADKLACEAREGDVLATMGAGDVTRAGAMILNALAFGAKEVGR